MLSPLINSEILLGRSVNYVTLNDDEIDPEGTGHVKATTHIPFQV